MAALFIDLDGFKTVNDTLGHGFGDQLLQAIAARLSVTIRESDSIGRLGGGDFVVLVDGSTMETGPELVAERLLAVLREPFILEGLLVAHSLSPPVLGIAAGLRSSATLLLRDADIALYQLKLRAEAFAVFSPLRCTRLSKSGLLLEMDLRDALARQEYYLVFPADLQPGQRRDHGSRGPLALAPSGAGCRSARRLHPHVSKTQA